MKGHMIETKAVLDEAKEICESGYLHTVSLIYYIIGLSIGFVGFLYFPLSAILAAEIRHSFTILLSTILVAIPLLFLSAMSLGGLLDILFNINAKLSKQEILSTVKEELAEKLGYKDVDIVIEKEISRPSLVILQGRAAFKADNIPKTSEIVVGMNTLDHILCVKVKDSNTVIYDTCVC